MLIFKLISYVCQCVSFRRVFSFFHLAIIILCISASIGYSSKKSICYYMCSASQSMNLLLPFRYMLVGCEAMNAKQHDFYG